jgi:DNA-3-methyladenine glycosylase I
MNSEIGKKTVLLKRCPWVGIDKPHYLDYHDNEWGVAVHDDQKLFEMLILEGAQAGLTWETILKRREHYRKVFKKFDPRKVAKLSDEDLERILQDPGVIRNRLKIYSTRKNAQIFLQIQQEFGSFNDYVWKFAPKNHKRPKNMSQIKSSSDESDALAKDLKQRGMSFVGTTIIYAFMQAIGMVDDHIADCFCAS